MSTVSKKIRCQWVKDEPLYTAYHDHEWGVPIYHDDRLLFEFLILEGMQAGLSWNTILQKRENFRESFHNFDAERIIHYKKADINKLLNNPGIIRNRLKIDSVITNANAYLEIKEEWPSFSEYIWHFVEGEPIQNHWAVFNKVPATSKISDQMSKDLKKRGFKFVGSTICYAFMQAVGMVNDHTTDCFRYKEVTKKHKHL
jgi:DNA-3-methyladenine glycosylase I